MDLGSRFAFFSVCLIVICVLRSTRCSNDKDSCLCPQIPQRPRTLNPPEKYYKINQTFRYECQEGLLRKAGTSSLIKCKQIGIGRVQWDPREPTLECIPDPKRTQPPKSTVTTGTERDVTETPTTPSIAAPLNGTAHPPEASPHAARTAVISCGTLVIACTLVGIGFFCYRRRRPKSHSPPPEEQIPMKEDPSE
ncbi:il15ra [Pungitius sinensis]